jgi:hypothetical protein
MRSPAQGMSVAAAPAQGLGLLPLAVAAGPPARAVESLALSSMAAVVAVAVVHACEPPCGWLHSLVSSAHTRSRLLQHSSTASNK